MPSPLITSQVIAIFFGCKNWVQFEGVANLGGEKEKKVKERDKMTKGFVGILAIAILAVGLIAVVAAEPISTAKSATAVIIGIVIVMAISAAVRLAKTSKVGPPSKFVVGSVNALVMIAMIAVNVRYLFYTKNKIATNPQKLIKSNGFLRI